LGALTESLGHAYFQRALLEAVLVGAVGGAIGVHVLLRRLQFFVVALSHATFPGVAVAAVVGASIYLGGAVAGAIVAVAVAALGAGRRLDDASAIGVVLAGAFAVGVVVLTASTGPARDLGAFMVGSILTVNTNDLVVAAAVAGAVAVFLFVAGKELVLGAFDREAFIALGYRRTALDLVLLLVVALVVVTAVPAVGTLLAVALLTIPPMTARLWAERVAPMTLIASCIGALAGVAGLMASAAWDVAAGGAIALATVTMFVGSAAIQWCRRRPSALRRTPATSPG